MQLLAFGIGGTSHRCNGCALVLCVDALRCVVPGFDLNYSPLTHTLMPSLACRKMAPSMDHDAAILPHQHQEMSATADCLLPHQCQFSAFISI